MLCEIATNFATPLRYWYQLQLVKGACGVGKSSILHRFRSDKFSPTYQPTIWDNYKLTKTFDGQEVELEIIDTAGLEGPDSPVTKSRKEKPA